MNVCAKAAFSAHFHQMWRHRTICLLGSAYSGRSYIDWTWMFTLCLKLGASSLKAESLQLQCYCLFFLKICSLFTYRYFHCLKFSWFLWLWQPRNKTRHLPKAQQILCLCSRVTLGFGLTSCNKNVAVEDEMFVGILRIAFQQSWL